MSVPTAADASAMPSAASPTEPDAAGAGATEYEFTANANLVIGDCGNRARIFGILCSISGAMQLIASLLALAGVVSGTVALFLVPAGAFNLILGVLLTRAGTALTEVVTTQGRDITLMLHALGAFSRAFFVQIVAAVVFLIWVGVTLAGFAFATGGILSKLIG